MRASSPSPKEMRLRPACQRRPEPRMVAGSNGSSQPRRPRSPRSAGKCAAWKDSSRRRQRCCITWQRVDRLSPLLLTRLFRRRRISHCVARLRLKAAAAVLAADRRRTELGPGNPARWRARSARSAGCEFTAGSLLDPAMFEQVAWQPYVKDISFEIPIFINWVGFYVQIQFRDGSGTLHPFISTIYLSKACRRRKRLSPRCPEVRTTCKV